MQLAGQLSETLDHLDGRGYKAYHHIKGTYQFDDFFLTIGHVQKDPFAAPSRLSVQVASKNAALPREFYSNKSRIIALTDFLSRSFAHAIQKKCKGKRGTGRSGAFTIDTGKQEVLERNSVVLTESHVEARFTAGLPASGRRILGRQAQEMLLQELPQIVKQALFYESLSDKKLKFHIETVEDQEAMRAQLDEMGLVAFIGNDSILPRRSGVDDRPLIPTRKNLIVPFQSSPDLEVELVRPNSGLIRGMGIPKGVTLIVGGGFHGKSTLLRALERGVYNHVPTDGRQWTVTVPSAIKIRAEDGRSVKSLDISPFIADLPYQKDTTEFCSENASGSTSQAANIMEALEMGTKVLLLDEDTSATNFIIRDARMQSLVAKRKEPITPLVDKVQQLFDQYGTSSILVMGGSGDYFDVAGAIIMMDNYKPVNVTKRAKEIVEVFPSERKREGGDHFGDLPKRSPSPKSFDPSRGKRDVRIDAKGLKSILFGANSVDLSAVEQLVDVSQTRAIGEAIFYYAVNLASEDLPLRDGLLQLAEELELKGLDILDSYKAGNLSRPRIFEIASAINRMRSLQILTEKKVNR